jgi:hypothetical protein
MPRAQAAADLPPPSCRPPRHLANVRGRTVGKRRQVSCFIQFGVTTDTVPRQTRSHPRHQSLPSIAPELRFSTPHGPNGRYRNSSKHLPPTRLRCQGCPGPRRPVPDRRICVPTQRRTRRPPGRTRLALRQIRRGDRSYAAGTGDSLSPRANQGGRRRGHSAGSARNEICRPEAGPVVDWCAAADHADTKTADQILDRPPPTAIELATQDNRK